VVLQFFFLAPKMTSNDTMMVQLSMGFEFGNLFTDSIVEVEVLPDLSPQVKFLNRVLNIKFFASTFNGIVKPLSVPSDSIAYPRTVMAALVTSPDSPLHEKVDQDHVSSIFHAIDTLRRTSDAAEYLGVDREDFRLAMSYRSESDSRIVHYPLTDEEKLRVRNQLENFLIFQIQNWLLGLVPQGTGPVFFARPKTTTQSSRIEQHISSLFTGGSNPTYPIADSDGLHLIKDVLNLLASTSSNRIVREMASEITVSVAPMAPVATMNWGDIRQRRRGNGFTSGESMQDPMTRKILEIDEWVKNRRIVDQSIVMHDFTHFSKSQQEMIFWVCKKFQSQLQLVRLNENFKKIQKPISVISTRAPPSIEDFSDLAFLRPPPPVSQLPKSVKIANVNFQIETLNKTVDTQKITIASLTDELVELRATIRSKDHMISELTNHCVRMKAHLFAYSDQMEDGTACEEFEYAKMWAEIEKLRIEKISLKNNYRGYASSSALFDETQKRNLKIRDEIIDLLNFVIVRTLGPAKQVSDEVNFAISKIRELMSSRDNAAAEEVGATPDLPAQQQYPRSYCS